MSVTSNGLSATRVACSLPAIIFLFMLVSSCGGGNGNAGSTNHLNNVPAGTTTTGEGNDNTGDSDAPPDPDTTGGENDNTANPSDVATDPAVTAEIMAACRSAIYEKVAVENDYPTDHQWVKDAVNATFEKLTGFDIAENVTLCQENPDAIQDSASSLLKSVNHETHFSSLEEILADERLSNILGRLDNISCLNKVTNIAMNGREVIAHLQSLLPPGGESELSEFLGANECTTSYITTIYFEGTLASVKIYLLRVANMISVELNNITPWSINSYSAKEIESLVRDNTFLMWDVPDEVWTASGEHSRYSIDDLNSEFYIDERTLHEVTENSIFVYDLEFTQLLPLAKKLMRWDTEATTKTALSWMMANFFHAYESGEENWGWKVYLDGRDDSLILPYPLDMNRLIEERVVGCHLPTMLYRNLLALLNIPAASINVNGHGVIYLPLMHRFIHGDHIADTGFLAPIDLALLTVDQIEELVVTDRSYIHLHADIREASEAFLFLYRQAESDQLYFSISKSWTKAPLALFNEEVGAWGFPELSESLNGNTYTSSSIRIKSMTELISEE